MPREWECLEQVLEPFAVGLLWQEVSYSSQGSFCGMQLYSEVELYSPNHFSKWFVHSQDNCTEGGKTHSHSLPGTNTITQGGKVRTTHLSTLRCEKGRGLEQSGHLRSCCFSDL